MKRIFGVLVGLFWAIPAHATLDDTLAPAPIEATCQMVEICSQSGRCAPFPAFGTLLLIETDNGYLMGRNADTLRPIVRYPSLDEALPALAESTGTGRREFLVDLPPEGADLRFSQYIQGFDPSTRERALRPRHFTLTCELNS